MAGVDGELVDEADAGEGDLGFVGAGRAEALHAFAFADVEGAVGVDGEDVVAEQFEFAGAGAGDAGAAAVTGGGDAEVFFFFGHGHRFGVGFLGFALGDLGLVDLGADREQELAGGEVEDAEVSGAPT